MTTDLAPGTAFVTRHRGGYRLWRVADSGTAYTTVQRMLQPGEVVHFAVFKGERLESRKQYTLKGGDVNWLDTGIRATDFSKPPGPNGYPCADHNIFRNDFNGGPQWLREAL